MYKKILLILLVFSPLIFSVFVGYPILSEKQLEFRKNQARENIAVSKRCSEVGDFITFIHCFRNERKIKALGLFNEVNEKVNRIDPLFSALLILSFIIFVICGVLILLI
jgi:hypothetical protein